MRVTRRAKVALAIAVSVAVHVAIAWVLPARQAAERHEAAAEVTFEIVARAGVHESASEVPASVEQAPVEMPRHRGVTRAAAPRASVAPEVVEASVPSGASAEASVEDVASVEVARIDLSPRAVALRATESAGRSCAALRADAGMECTKEDEGALARWASERMTAALEVAAGDGLRSKADEKPELVRVGDGSYRFEGVGFVARVGRDGEVSFEDRPVVQVAPIPIAGTFDLMDAIEGGIMGRELHAREKRWFLEGTQALRAELAERELARVRMLGRTSLEQGLTRLARDTSRSLAARHADIFALWDDCAGDEHGTAAQELIERFVRREMPEGSASAFTANELEALNRARASARRFDPYRVADAGAQPG